jgi:solute carrier family 35 protein E1
MGFVKGCVESIQGELEPLADKVRNAIGEEHFNRVVLFLFFLVWYTLTVGYNITNEKAGRIIKLPFTIASWQFFLGVPYVVFMWYTGIRPIPHCYREDRWKALPLAFFHMMTHVSAVYAMFMGSVAFTHIVKAGEPVSTAILSFALLGQTMSWQSYLALLPVVGGVGAASYGEIHFNFHVFFGALGSMLGSSLRAIYSKKVMNNPIGENLGPASLYGVLTILSTFMLLPIMLAAESWRIRFLWLSKVTAVQSSLALPRSLLVCYYLYNEVAFMTLHKVAPLTHSVANTFKHIFIIVASFLFLSGDINFLGWIGGGVTV